MIAQMTRLEFDSICRLCVQIFEKEKVSPIFNNETYNDKISLPERIRYCSSVEVSVDDGLPPQICNTCLLKLNESFVFRNQCVLADITLKRLKDFSFNVNEIPNLSQVDIENQIIKSENNDCLHFVHSSPELINGIKSKENIDEFDNSKNGRHKRNIQKLKSIPLQKKKTFNRKPKESIALQNFSIPEDLEEKLFTSPVILTFKKRKKVRKKDSEKEIVAGSTNEDSKSKKQKNLKGIKQFLKIHEKLNSSFRSQDKTDVSFNKESDFKNTENDSPESHFGEIGNCANGIVDPKCLTPKKSKRKKLALSREKPSSFKCDHCHKVYPSEGGWRYHVHTVHNENYQPFICDLCGESFKVKKNLEAHKNSIHFHLKLHLCDLCGRGFASKYSLKVHKSWHNDEKNFSCDVCGTKFRTRGKMNTHRSIHGGPKKFMCHICSRDFRWKKDFEIHMRTHTGEKPFKCSHCGKAFASLTNMKKHEKNHMKKLELNEISEKFDVMTLPNDGKLRRNEFLNFGFGSEDVRNSQTNQVSGTALYLICK